MKFHIVVFGCAANTADAERLEGVYSSRGYIKTASLKDTDLVVIVTCMIRQSAEDRVTGLLRNLAKEKANGRKIKVVLTGCMVGMAIRDTTGKYLTRLKKKYPVVDEFLPVEEIGYEHEQLRKDKKHALVLVSNGCNNFCSYCVVPYARGREVSRPFDDIIDECKSAAKKGCTDITLVGQNVNSYGADLFGKNDGGERKNSDNKKITYVKHLGKMRIPTLFPALLEKVCEIDGITSVDFISSNPWDFSDALMRVIGKNPKVKRLIHLPVQSGDGTVLKRMNRWYTPKAYIRLIQKIRKSVPGVFFSTDIIVGFPGETKKQFENTVSLCKTIGFVKAYISMYSDRPMTLAHKTMNDDVSYEEKKRRWEILDMLINKTNLQKGTYPLAEK